MRREQRQFPLSLEFVRRATPADEYVAGVDVTIRDHHGNTELHTVADGPILLAALPAGRYTITADVDGRARTRQVLVARNKPEHVVFVW